MARKSGSHDLWLSRHDVSCGIPRYSEDEGERTRLRCLLLTCPWERGCQAAFVVWLKRNGAGAFAEFVRGMTGWAREPRGDTAG
jgi:hypothetical protein